MKKVHFAAIALLTFTGLNLPASPSMAEEISCQGTLGAITVDNVKVPSGKTCNLNGTRVGSVSDLLEGMMGLDRKFVSIDK